MDWKAIRSSPVIGPIAEDIDEWCFESMNSTDGGAEWRIKNKNFFSNLKYDMEEENNNKPGLQATNNYLRILE